jgi:hypothetical protein
MLDVILLDFRSKRKEERVSGANTGKYNNCGQWFKFFEMNLKRKS